MSGRLCDISKRMFDSVIRSQGWHYFRARHVALKNQSDMVLETMVRGTRVYDVRLNMRLIGNRADILMTCTCPYYESKGFCKHIWATLLLADLRGWVQPPEHISQYIFKDLDDIRETEDWDVGDFSTGEDYPIVSPSFKPPAESLKPVAISWKDMLKLLSGDVKDSDAVSGFSGRELAEAEIRYVIPIETLYQTSRLCVNILMRSMRKDESWGAWQACTAAIYEKQLSDEDNMLLLSLAGADKASTHSWQNSANNFRYIEPLHARKLLPVLCATQQLFATYRGQEYGPLSWDTEGAWSDALEVKRAAHGDGYTVSSVLVRGDERRPLSKPLIVLSEGWIIWPHAVSPLQPAAGFAWVAHMRKQQTLQIPKKDISEFLVSLMNMPKRPPLSLPDELGFKEERVKPVPHLFIEKSPGHSGRELPVRFSFHYNDIEVGAWDSRAELYQIERHVAIPRDKEFEQQAIAAFKGAGGAVKSRQQYENQNGTIKKDKLARLVTRLVAAGWKIETQGKLYRNPGSFNVSVASGIDWFDLHVNCDFDGMSVTFPRLLEALQKKEQWIQLDDGSFGILPEEWLEKFGGIAALGEVEEDAVRFQAIQAGLLDVWLEAQPEVCVDQVFQETREKLRQAAQIEPKDPSKEFSGTLRPYQRDGLGWLFFLQHVGVGGCLADDMGLGKTVQLLAMLEMRHKKNPKKKRPPSLVVAPSSIIFNWIRESSVFTPNLRFFEHTGIKRPKDFKVFDDYDIIITTYGTMRRDIAKFKKYTFDWIVLDESQAIKNAGAQTSKASRLLKGAHRVALSGTPIENHLTELWSLFEFLNPGLLGRRTAFNKRWGKNPDPEACALLSSALRPFILRRTKGQVATDLPDRQEETLFCELPPKQRSLYQELQQHYKRSLLSAIDDKGLNRSKMQVLEALLRLRQAACHPALINKEDTDSPAAKFELLLPQLKEVIEEGHKALVFSQFTTFLGLLRQQLDKEGIVYEYLDGRTRKRERCVDRFQTDPECPLFLISLKAGGLGLNLTAAEYVFLLDPWWNPAVEAQAIDRAHRIGQTNKVFAYRLIAKDTVEEKIMALQESKRNLADAIINQDNALIRNLTADDLAYLLG